MPALASAIFIFYLVFGILRSGYLVGYFSSATLVTLRGRLRVAVLDTAEQQPGSISRPTASLRIVVGYAL